MRLSMNRRASRWRASRREQSRDLSVREESAKQGFWPWLAVAVLIVCWLAEASMCAARGF
jgi:hypothetical protein